MKIEIRLKEVLQGYGLDRHGIVQDIARALDLHRHTIQRLYNNEMTNPPLDVLGRVCDYLIERGVPQEVLPQALFGARPAEIWKALLCEKKVTMYLGEYEKLDEPVPTRRWISRRDASVATQMIERLSRAQEHQRPQVHIEYVSFRFNAQDPSVTAEEVFLDDKKHASEVFKQMRGRPKGEAAVLIGSQRVNYLTEHFVADLFGCEPFPEPANRSNVPFFLIYRSYDRVVSSCFGGAELPGGQGTPVPGVYYRDEKGKWACCPWVLNERDGGIVIVVYDPRNQDIELALLGFSGRGTTAIGTQLVHNAHQFWPPYADHRGRSVGVYICEMTFVQTGQAGRDETLHLRTFKPIQLSPAILKKHLS